ncbi:MAG: HlyD family secretion protein [Limisphaerales bacterium]
MLAPLLLIGGFVYYWFWMRPYESTDDAFIDANVTPIAPRVAGQVSELLVDDNQAVTNGELLLTIDPRDFEAKLAQTKAGLAASQTQLEQARAQLVLDQAKVVQQRANLSSAQVEAQRAQADLERYQALQKSAVSQSQLDLASAQARSTAAAVEVAQSQVKAAEAQVNVAEAAIQTAEAEVQGNEATVHQAELVLSYTKVLAPRAGFVAHRTIEAGAYVQPGQQLLALVPPKVWVTANFKETQLTKMRPGQPVTIDVDAYPGHTFRGHVDSIQRGSGAQFSLLPPENATGNYVKVVQRVPVKIVFDEPPDPNLPLGPGMSVEPQVNVLAKANGQKRAQASE